MDENVKTSKQMEAVLRQKIDEFDTLDIESEHIKDAAEALVKAADVEAKLAQEDRNKKEWIFKTLGIIVGAAAGIIAAMIKAISDQKINEKQLDYFGYEHSRAYEFEEFGKTEHIVTSPAAKDALRERPRQR